MLERLIAEGLHLARKRKLQTELVCDNTCKLPSRNAGTVGKFSAAEAWIRCRGSPTFMYGVR